MYICILCTLLYAYIIIYIFYSHMQCKRHDMTAMEEVRTCVPSGHHTPHVQYCSTSPTALNCTSIPHVVGTVHMYTITLGIAVSNLYFVYAPCSQLSLQLFDARNHYHDVACTYCSNLNTLQTKTRVEFLERLVSVFVWNCCLYSQPCTCVYI